MALALLGLLIGGIFFLGIGTALYLSIRLLIWLCGSSQQPKVNVSSVSNRDAELNIVIREAIRACSFGRLSTNARDELLAYADHQKGEERRKREATATPAHKPAIPTPVFVPHTVPTPQPVTPASPPAPPPPAAPIQRDPSAIRAAIERLHEHAKEPERTEQPPAQPATPSIVTTGSKMESDGPAQSTMPPLMANVAASLTAKPNERSNAHEAFAVSDAKAQARPWTERLFTPENVRILQSLGIALIFFSAVAYVRTQMWDSASVVTQMLLLLGGTGACMGLGFALRRWTDLRITGLGFLVLGHLSIVLDTFAALAPRSLDSRALYPFAPGSLWTVTLTVFAASAFWHARKLQEPLFEAFTFFGALAAWGAGAQWLHVTPWQMAVAYVPSLLACRFLYPLGIRDGQSPRRWSLTWWTRSAWELCGPLLAVVEVALVLIGQNGIRNDLWMHLTALLVLGATMLWDACASERKQMAHFGCATLISVWPLAAFASTSALWEYPMTLALPAATLVLAALAWSKWRGTGKDETTGYVTAWGITVVSIAAACAVLARLVEPASVVSAAWTSGALSCVGLALMVLRRSVAGAWLATIGIAMFSAMLLDLTGIGLAWMPVLWLTFALILTLFSHPLAVDAREQADLLAFGGLAGVVYFCVTDPHAVWASASATTGLYGPAPASQVLGWIALTAFTLLSSITRREPWRRLAGVAIAGPTLLYLLNGAGIHFATPVLWTLVLATAAWVAVEARAKREENRELLAAGWTGLGLLLLQSLLLCLHDLALSEYGLASWDLLAFGAFLTAVSVRCRRSGIADDPCVTLEILSLGALSGSALCLLNTWQFSAMDWTAALPLMASVALFLSLCLERLIQGSGSARPFRTAGEVMALMASCAGLFIYLFKPDLLTTCPLAIIWLAAFPTLYLAVRSRIAPATPKPAGSDPSTTTIIAAAHLLLSILLCVGLTLHRDFWAAGISANVRVECAVFYAVMLALSVTVGVWLRNAFAPFIGGSAALALTACAYGAWGLNYETFGLPAMVSALALLGMGVWLHKNSDSREGQSMSAYIAGILAALFACGYLVVVLAIGPKTGLQAPSVSAWLLAALAVWYAGRTAAQGVCGFGCGMALLLAGLHGLRWAAVPFTAFGPAIGAFALALLAAREIAEFLDMKEDVKPHALRGRAGGLLIVAYGSMLLAGVFALVGYLDDRPWHWVGTLVEGGLFLGTLTVLSRRRNKEAPAGLLLLAELGMWALLVMALGFGVEACGYARMLQGATWAGIGALALFTGMIFESLAGAVVGPPAQARVPGAFLESRHLVAAGCAALALVTALLMPHATERVWMEAIWQACLGATLLAIYGSLARSSISEQTTKAVRYGCALSAYTILIPLGYLAFLKSQSTGDSYGALWFIALAPTLLGVAWLLDQEREAEQAALARLGALMVSGGALVLAFAANNACLAEVPAWTFFILGLESLLMRRWRHRKEWTVTALAAFSGAVFYAIRALHGDPAWGMQEAWVWEGAWMAGLGLTLTVAGGLTRWERDQDDHSIVAMCGCGLTTASILLMFFSLLMHGRTVAYMGVDNTARLDAFNIALILSAAASAAAWHWLRFAAGKWVAAAQLLTAYALTIWAWHVVTWEYYTIPPALLCFFWAWQSEHSTEIRDALASRVWQSLGSALLLLPSFIQAMPYSDAAAVHFFTLAALALILVGGAMWTRRKIPLLSASSALLLCTIIKTAQWAAHREVILPVAGIGLGFAVLAVGCLFESRMNRVFRTATDQVRAQAKMFWTNWD